VTPPINRDSKQTERTLGAFDTNKLMAFMGNLMVLRRCWENLEVWPFSIFHVPLVNFYFSLRR
jgi:hypothetical protein